MAKAKTVQTVKLLSTKGRAQLIERFYFYDGESAIKDGVIEIPLDKPEWVQRAWIMGFRLNPETEAFITLDEALSGTQVSPVAPDSAKSAGAKNEGSSGRGQSPR